MSFHHSVPCFSRLISGAWFLVSGPVRLSRHSARCELAGQVDNNNVSVSGTALSEDQWYHAELTFNDLSAAVDTYDLRIIEAGVGEIINVTGLPFRTNVDDIDRFLFNAGSSGANRSDTAFYLDNITINNGVLNPASIVGWSVFSSNVMEMVVSTPDLAMDYYPKTTTDLVSGTWVGAAHSKDGSDPFTITNLAYSSTDGSNEVIYVKSDDAAAFFGIGEQF